MATVQAPPFPNFAPVLEKDRPENQGIDEACLERLYERIDGHIATGWYPGAAIAMARHGTLVAARSFGAARLKSAVSFGPALTEPFIPMAHRWRLMTLRWRERLNRGELSRVKRLSSNVPTARGST